MPLFPFSGGIALRKPCFARDEILAQDGWSQFDSELTSLEATVIDNNINGSDRTLQVRAADGFNWTIELADRARNEQAGLVAASTITGDQITVLGMRATQFGENRIKAVQLTIGENCYQLYPELLNGA